MSVKSVFILFHCIEYSDKYYFINFLLQMQGMMHHGQQFGNSYGNQRSHVGPNMHPSMNGMNMMGQNPGPIHGNMMPSGVMGSGNNMNKLVMQVSGISILQTSYTSSSTNYSTSV